MQFFVVMRENSAESVKIYIKTILIFSVKYMSVIRLKINETIIIKYTGEKIQITCKCDSLLELKQFSVFS